MENEPIVEKVEEVKVDEDKIRSEKKERRIRKQTVPWNNDFSIPKTKYGQGVLIMEFFKEAPIVATIFILIGIMVGVVVGFFLGLFLGLVF